MLKITLTVSKFWLRHFSASMVSIAIPTILVVVIYVGLVMVAIVTASDLGGPLALPFWMLTALVVSILYTTFLLFPSVWIAEMISRRFGKWRFVWEIFISTIVLGILIFAATFVLNGIYNRDGMNLIRNNPGYVFIALLIPLGIYWWTAKLVELGILLPARIWNKLHTQRQNIRKAGIPG
jgi:hypothetical protein